MKINALLPVVLNNMHLRINLLFFFTHMEILTILNFENVELVWLIKVLAIRQKSRFRLETYIALGTVFLQNF